MSTRSNILIKNGSTQVCEASIPKCAKTDSQNCVVSLRIARRHKGETAPVNGLAARPTWHGRCNT